MVLRKGVVVEADVVICVGMVGESVVSQVKQHNQLVKPKIHIKQYHIECSKGVVNRHSNSF